MPDEMNSGCWFRKLVVTLAVVCWAFCGCTAANKRIVTWKGVEASRYLNQIPSAGSDYTDLNVNLDQCGQALSLRMPDGKMLRTPDITLDTVWPYTFFGHMDNKLPKNAAKGFQTFQVLFPINAVRGGGYGFGFQNGRLVSVGASCNAPAAPESKRPGLGLCTNTVLYSMPISEEQLLKLFGPYQSKKDVRAGL